MCGVDFFWKDQGCGGSLSDYFRRMVIVFLENLLLLFWTSRHLRRGVLTISRSEEEAFLRC